MVIKICGLTRQADINYVNIALPDYIGFVFAKSKRQVNIKQAKQLKDKLDYRIKAVGVFVNSPIEYIKEIVDLGIIDIIQLHGFENKQYIEQLKQVIKLPIIKAIKVNNSSDLLNINYDVDYYLLDNAISGSGKCFDWSLIKELNKPFFLAGGINLDNLTDAIKIGSYGLDVSSGVETNGVKDFDKILEMIRRIKNGNR